LKEQLRLLKELQAIDSRRQETRKSIDALPERLRPAKQDLAKLEAMLQQERVQVADTEKWRAEQEELVKREEEAVRQAKSKLQQSRNSKDFAAASREVENKRRMIAEREEELLKVIGAMEQTRAQLAQREKDVEALRQTVATEEATVGARIAELTAELQQDEGGREALASQVQRELLRRYEQVQKRRGIAVVPVVDGICKGCFMSLPPQLGNIIARGTSLESCPSCQRLLYRAELMGETETEGTPAP
jgi:predicted  nucleic acid-binding Zn-ribbon protein